MNNTTNTVESLATSPTSLGLGNVILSIFIALIGYVIYDFLDKYTKLRHINGPTPLPLIGNTYMENCCLKFSYFLLNMREQYGPVFLFWAATTPMVVVTDPMAVKEILTKEKIFKKGDEYEKVFSIGFGRGLVTQPDRETHAKRKAAVLRFFLKKNIEEHVPNMNRIVIELVNDKMLGKNVDLNNFDIAPFFNLFTFKLICKIAFGLDVNEDLVAGGLTVQEYYHNISAGSRVMGRCMIFSMLATDLNPQIRRVKEERLRAERWAEELLLRGREKEDIVDKPNDVVEALLKAGVSRKEIYEHIYTIVGAGNDTTAMFGCFISYFLAHYPEVQNKCREEIEEALKDTGRKQITIEEVPKLKYLNCVFKEVIRLRSVIPQILRQATQDTTIGDIKVPGGTVLLLPFTTMHRDPKLWENPKEFKPERFKDLKGEFSAEMGFLPFGYGSRTCIGNVLAFYEMNVTFSTLLQQFTFEPVEGFKPEITDFGVSLVTCNGMRVKLRPRDCNMNNA